jgi:hypothetical protein
MELKGPIARIEVLEINNNSVALKLQTFAGEEYLQDFAKGDVVQVSIPEDPEDYDYSYLENYLSGPIPPESLHGIEEESAESFEPAPVRRNAVLEELLNLAPQLGHTPCTQCGKNTRLVITHEGIILLCRECGQSQRVEVDLLQRLIDAVGILCFSCATGKLKSEATEYAHILKCQNPDCGSHNSWRGISDRFLS